MKTIRKIDKKKLAKYIVVGSTLAFISIEALAALDLNKAADASLSPFVKATSDHWMKLTGLTGVGTALFAQGDMRAKASLAFIGSCTVASVCLGILAVFT